MPEPFPPHPVFRPDGDQLEMLTALLDCFPGQSGNPDVLVPIHPQVRQAWAQTLINRGIVVVPELMQELPVATGTHPEAAWLQPQRWVSRAEYAEQAATQEATAPASTPEQQTEQAKAMLRAVKPSLLDRIEAMKDPVQREREAARLAEQIPTHINAVTAALEQVERAKAKEES